MHYKEIGALREVLYFLYHVENIYTDKLTKNIANDYSPIKPDDEILFRALQQVIATPNFNFDEVLPGLPHNHEVIVEYLKMFYDKFIEEGFE